MTELSPGIITLAPKKLVGQSIQMSLAHDLTSQLWRGFMPLRKKIIDSVGSDLYAVQVYDEGLDIDGFSPNTVFEKWAAVEVTSFENIPPNMKQLDLGSGLYAVFTYSGGAKGFPELLQYIYTMWLPNSEYVLDSRPHFEILGEKYKNDHPDSEEEVWIPIKK